MPTIIFTNNDASATIRNQKKLKIFLLSLFKKEKISVESLTYIFCSDEYLKSLNKKFLDHDFYTDILTFELSEPGQPIISEIYISIDRVRENAKKFNCTYTSELLRVIVHGALHLSGYDDKSSIDKKAMRAREDYFLKAWGST